MLIKSPDAVAEQIVQGSVKKALDKASEEQVALAIVSGLAAVRDLLTEHGGISMLGEFDDFLYDVLIDQAEAEADRVSGDLHYVKMPMTVQADTRSKLIIQDAVQSCMIVAAYDEEQRGMEAATEYLLLAMSELLGGLPEWAELHYCLSKQEASKEASDNLDAVLVATLQ